MIIFVLGAVLGLVLGFIGGRVLRKRDIEEAKIFVAEKLSPKQYAQFIEPMSVKEKFDKSNNVGDLLE